MKKIIFLIISLYTFFLPVYGQTSLNELTVFSDKPIALSLEEKEDLSEKILEYWNALDQNGTSVNEEARIYQSDKWNIHHYIENRQIILKIVSRKNRQTFYHSFSNTSPLNTKFKQSLNYYNNDKISENITHILKELESIAPIQTNHEPTQASTMWGEREQTVIQEVMELESKVTEFWAKMVQEQNLDDESKRIKQIIAGNVHIEDPLLGNAEINMIDDKPFVRIAHKATELSFVIFDGPVDYESTHFKQYISRQHIDAGSSRNDGKLGRDVIIIAKDNKVSHDGFYDPSNFHSIPKPKAFVSKQWWEEWLRATYKVPTKSVVGFGSVCGIAQGALGLCVAGLNKLVDPASELNLTPAAFSMVWGTGIGSFVSTYKNWLNRGTKLMRTIKSSSNSTIFAYALVAMMHPDGMQALSILDPSGLLLNASILGNIWANNMAKVNWNDFARVREFMGVSRKNFVIKLPGNRRWETQVAQSAVESQSIYLAPFTIRLLDLTGFTVASFPMGKFILWSSIPVVEYAVLKYLEKIAAKTQHPKAIELANKHRASWELKKKFFYDKKLRGLILNKIYYRLTFQKRKATYYAAQLARNYPEFYKHITETEIEKKKDLLQFTIPNRTQSPIYPTQASCKSIFSVLIGH